MIFFFVRASLRWSGTLKIPCGELYDEIIVRMARRASMVAGAVLACCNIASALNPSLDINQYAHNSWTIRDGFFKCVITSIAQTPDGYLWLGTEFGLLRFDGVRSVPWQPPAGEHLPSTYIRSVLAGRDGRLWIGTTQGLASWKDGKLTHYPELAGQNVHALLEDREGVVWAGSDRLPTGKTLRDSGWQRPVLRTGRQLSAGGSFPCTRIAGAIFGRRGAIGLWRWKPAPPKLYPMPDTPPETPTKRQRRAPDLYAQRNQTVSSMGKPTRIRFQASCGSSARPAAPGPRWRLVDRD